VDSRAVFERRGRLRRLVPSREEHTRCLHLETNSVIVALPRLTCLPVSAATALTFDHFARFEPMPVQHVDSTTGECTDITGAGTVDSTVGNRSLFNNA
jgi:hypothetical protein